jgi:hypothetical protein
MDLNDSAVDECVFKVGIITHVFEKTLENVRFRPSLKPPERAVPTAKAGGRSRHGDPVRTRHKTASKNKRLSFAVAPASLILPGRRGSSRRHNMSDTTNRSSFIQTSILGV